MQDDQAAQPAADAVDQPAADAAAVGPDALDEMQREVDDAFELIWEGLFYHYDQSIESIVTIIRTTLANHVNLSTVLCPLCIIVESTKEG